MLKIRSTPTEAEQTGYMNSQSTEPEKAEFHTQFPIQSETVSRRIL